MSGTRKKLSTQPLPDGRKGCRKCGRQDSIHIHHIIAVSDGGSDDPKNLIYLCAGCHAEWHMFEMVCTVPFKWWMKAPPAWLLTAQWLEVMDFHTKKLKEGEL